MNVRPLPAAVDDAATIAASLERFRAGWGDAFEAAMLSAATAIGAHPQMYPRTEDGPEEPENREYFIA